MPYPNSRYFYIPECGQLEKVEFVVSYYLKNGFAGVLLVTRNLYFLAVWLYLLFCFVEHRIGYYRVSSSRELHPELGFESGI